MKLYLSPVKESSLAQKKKTFKYSLFHETATNELLWTTVNLLMLLIPSVLQQRHNWPPFHNHILRKGIFPFTTLTAKLRKHLFCKSGLADQQQLKSPLQDHLFQEDLQELLWNVKKVFIFFNRVFQRKWSNLKKSCPLEGKSKIQPRDALLSQLV